MLTNMFTHFHRHSCCCLFILVLSHYKHGLSDWMSWLLMIDGWSNHLLCILCKHPLLLSIFQMVWTQQPRLLLFKWQTETESAEYSCVRLLQCSQDRATEILFNFLFASCHVIFAIFASKTALFQISVHVSKTMCNTDIYRTKPETRR